MAAEKKRVLGELAAWQLAGIAAMFGTQISPTEINPYRVWTAKEIAARRKYEKARFFGRMSQALFGQDLYNPQPAEGS